MGEGQRPFTQGDSKIKERCEPSPNKETQNKDKVLLQLANIFMIMRLEEADILIYRESFFSNSNIQPQESS